MIKFNAHGKDGPIYGFVLTRGNLEQLMLGRPIVVNLPDVGGPRGKVMILFGETERALYDELKACGAIGPETGAPPEVVVGDDDGEVEP